jgi:ATP-dependent helicase/nuclease subunit A
MSNPHSPVDQAARDAIRDQHERTLFVEAGAGTGKTTALVARVVEMVAAGHLEDMAQLGAITFTENAAAELRSRIREALEQAERGRFAGRSYDDDQSARCARALAHLDDATISTLHGFAARILSGVPIEAGLPPGFSVSDPITAQLESARAWRGFLDELLDDAAVTGHILAGLTLGLDTDRLRALASSFSNNWDLLLKRPFAIRPMPRVDASTVLEPLRRAAAALDRAPEGDKLTKHLLTTVRPAVNELSNLSDDLDVLEALYRLRLNTKAGNASNWAPAGGKAGVTSALVEARDARQDLLTRVGAAVTETLCARVQDFVLTETERRRAEGRLEFHDLLVRARDVLRDNADVRTSLHRQYRTLLVDEFQDTDPLQVEIVCLIAGDCGDVPPEDWADITIPPGRLFFVGDPKQSIYRFRRADVSLFSQTGELHRDGHTRLDVNFRSVPGLLDAVNDVFRVLIGTAGAEQVTYADLIAHRDATDDQPPLALLGGPLDLNAAALREKEAAHIAATIKRAKAERWEVHRTRNDPRSPDATYADIAVLLPTRTSLPALESALAEADIPYRVESRSLVWATDAVRDVVTMLQSVLNPADEVATVAALRHHGLACSDRHLLEWATAGGRWSYLAPRPEGVSPDHPVAAGMAALRTWHDLRWWLPVNHLVDRVVRELRLTELTAELPRPRDHWRRLRFVVDQARAFCDAGGSGLAEFVAWAVEQIESEADVLETAVPEPDDDSVRILTVHGSKGLEFPITVLAGLGVPPRSDAEVLWGGSRPEARLKSGALESEGFGAQKTIEKQLDLAESVRLLYVAMTRAEDHLVVSCYHKPVSSASSHAQRLWDLLADSPLATVEMEPPVIESDKAVVTDTVAPDREDFLASRAALLAEVKSRVAASATSLVSEADRSTAPGASDEPPVTASPLASPAGIAASGVGPRVGSAVHGVLELVDLAGPGGDEVARLSAMLCEQLGIPALADEVAARVDNALTADLVARADTGRYWREVYVVSRDGERYVEGYVDLLVETPDGLVVVDYKTDRATSEAERATKAEHYRPQLRAYAHALSQVPGLNVASGSLLFLSASGADEVGVDTD